MIWSKKKYISKVIVLRSKEFAAMSVLKGNKMLEQEFEKDMTGSSSESISSGTLCLESRVFNLESTTAKEFRSIDVRLTTIESMLPHLATKADLHKLETAVNRQFASFQADMGSLRIEMADLRTEIRTDMGKMQSTLIKWFAATSFGTMAIVVALIGAVLLRG